jgi:hypothetical protein
MALYKNIEYLTKSKDTEFDEPYSPGQKAPYDGIYRCQFCPKEIVRKSDDLLPKHDCKFGRPTLWWLIVSTYHQGTEVFFEAE